MHRILPSIKAFWGDYIIPVRVMGILEKTDQLTIPNAVQKRPFTNHHQRKTKRRKIQTSGIITGSAEEILDADVRALLSQVRSAELPIHIEPVSDGANLAEIFSLIDLRIESLSSIGDGLARNYSDERVYVVPFTAPGDSVRAKIIRHDSANPISFAEVVEILNPSPDRDDRLVKCRYFASCSGCQFQMLPYAYQLSHKKTVLEKAYANFSGLEKGRIPKIGDTISSPLQYAYRTKLTPHFDGPPGGRRARRNGEAPKFHHTPPIGFMKKGTRKTLDIEECPIGTQSVQMGLKIERARVAKELEAYKRGATLLLRESTTRVHKKISKSAEHCSERLIGEVELQGIREEHSTYTEFKTCITNSNATSTEYVSSYVFTNPAGAFFQNNNSILPVFTDYIRSVILPRPPAISDLTEPHSSPKITNLIDAYCGSGLFTITLSSLFQRSIGIDVSALSIACATRNAQLNDMPSTSVDFIAADANALFARLPTVPSADKDSIKQELLKVPRETHRQQDTFLPESTAVILDPPRKGCDESFLEQLLEFGPERIVYVSCNVHTQARDVGWILRKGRNIKPHGDDKKPEGNGETRESAKLVPSYEIESLRGFDFFPQTGHVEGVAVLRRIRSEKTL